MTWAFSRSLLASYLYRGKVLAWQCSLCGKMFLRTLAETEDDSDGTRPDYITSAFRAHSCEVQLLSDVEKREGRPIGMGLHRR